ncbi:hypothetical protein M422DRAFT_52798 [Sphaerobolus stellatus SS14]|uniref:Uncharacterized protein n=1 Tax=Sphaerobolus stellatus (strain SS14) TaxID=990650 RepID=A0A0C9TQW2_SPHS4|nr:hypothetical protein M422DRAFT_52798 [Sphaerobolus stellatus SS14]
MLVEKARAMLELEMAGKRVAQTRVMRIGTDVRTVQDESLTPTSARKRASNSGVKNSTKRPCKSGADALYAVSEAIEAMSSALAGGESSGHMTTPQRKIKAIRTVENEEELSDSGIADVVTLFTSRDKHDMYLAFSNKHARKIWLGRELAKLNL